MADVKLYACSVAAKAFQEVAAALNGGTVPIATTIGNVTVYLDPPTDAIRRHEAVHVRQQAAMAPWWLRWLPLSARAWAGTPRFLVEYISEHRVHGYEFNRFEIEARAAE